jgi:hypothetical protein
MYTLAYLPAVVSATQSPHWTYSPKALATHGNQRPYRPDDVTVHRPPNMFISPYQNVNIECCECQRGHALELLTKEAFIKQMEEAILLRDATPNDMHEARTADPYWHEYICNFERPDRIKIFRTYPFSLFFYIYIYIYNSLYLLKSYLKKKIDYIFRPQSKRLTLLPVDKTVHLFYLDRLRAEPGKLPEIYERWKKEHPLRHEAVLLREVAWECDRNVVQNLERCFIRDCKSTGSISI